MLITLSKVSASGAVKPVARTYDGHGWEALASSPLPPASAVDPSTYALVPHDRSDRSSQLDACAQPGSHCEVLIPADATGCAGGTCTYRLDRYESANLTNPTRRAASRFLLQSTFGPTRALLDGPLGSDMSLPMVRNWIASQMSEPATTLRSYVRRATNPRIRRDLEGILVRVRRHP